MIRIKLGTARILGEGEEGDAAEVLPRRFTGFASSMSRDELVASARGWWKISPERARNEKYVLAVGDGTVLFAAEITGWHVRGDRRAWDGTLLTEGHPVHDEFVGKPDPGNPRSMNPIVYIDSDHDYRPCRCGCRTPVKATWAVGHDQQALHRILSTYFTDVDGFVTWCENNDRPLPLPDGQAG